jgi:hypothetical protein
MSEKLSTSEKPTYLQNIIHTYKILYRVVSNLSLRNKKLREESQRKRAESTNLHRGTDQSRHTPSRGLSNKQKKAPDMRTYLHFCTISKACLVTNLKTVPHHARQKANVLEEAAPPQCSAEADLKRGERKHERERGEPERE